MSAYSRMITALMAGGELPYVVPRAFTLPIGVSGQFSYGPFLRSFDLAAAATNDDVSAVSNPDVIVSCDSDVIAGLRSVAVCTELGSVPVAATYVNGIINPSFEVGVANWAVYQNGPTGTIATSTTSAFGSNAAVLTSTSAGPGDLGAISSPVSVTPGDVWTLSGYSKANSTVRAVGMIAVWLDANQTFMFSTFGTTSGNSNSAYTRAPSLTVTVPAGAAFMNVYLQVTGISVNGEQHFVDGMMASRGPVLVPYADGSTPGWAWTGTANASSSYGPIASGNLITNPNWLGNTLAGNPSVWTHLEGTGTLQFFNVYSDSNATRGRSLRYRWDNTSGSNATPSVESSARTVTAAHPVTATQPYSARAKANVAQAGINGVAMQILFLSKDGAVLGNPTTAGQAGTGIKTLLLENQIAPLGAVAALISLYDTVAPGSSWDLTVFDPILAPGVSVPRYVDGDTQGFVWSGTKYASRSLTSIPT